LAENASFDALMDKICPAVFAVGDDKKKGKGMKGKRKGKERKEKKRKGKGREGTQSHKTLYFSYLWGGHPWADSHKIWQACCPQQRNQCVNFF